MAKQISKKQEFESIYLVLKKEYKRVNGKDFPYELEFHQGWVVDVSESNFWQSCRLDELAQTTSKFQRKPDFKPKQPPKIESILKIISDLKIPNTIICELGGLDYRYFRQLNHKNNFNDDATRKIWKGLLKFEEQLTNNIQTLSI